MATACLLLSLVTAADPSAPLVVKVIDGQHIDHATHHVQGLAVTADHYWISSVDRAAKQGFVFRVDRATGKVLNQREVSLGTQFHPGGIELSADALWVPVAEYRPRSTSTMLKLDPTTLATQSSFAVDDHLGCVALTDKDELLAANWDARVFYRFDQQGKQLGQSDNPRRAAYQDMKRVGDLILACGTEPSDGRPQPVIDRLHPQTLALVSRWQPQGAMRTPSKNLCREGCAVYKEHLFLMPEDGPDTTIYRCALPTP